MKMSKIIFVLLLFFGSLSISWGALLLEEDFENPLVATEWKNVGGILTNAQAAQGNQSINISSAGNYFVTWSNGVATSAIGVHTELWVEYYQYVGSDNGNEYNYVGARNPSGGIPLELRTKGNGAGSGTYNLISFDGRSGYYATVLANLPINTWERFLFGVKITDTTRGNGVYSIYREADGQWQNLVEEAAYRSFSDLNPYVYFLKVQIGTNNTNLFVDNVKIYDANPIPEPCTLFALGVGSMFVLRKNRRR